PTSVNEATWVNYQLEKNLGGTPQEVPENYRMYSPYVPDMNIDDRLQLFSSVAVRVYTEPDILWWLGHRQKSYYGMNAIDAAALVRDLRVLGNEQAELIATTEKGHHPDGRRHPHSWSIVDNAELVDWFLESLHAPAQ
ncbi:MAG: hypothetical protein OEQ53_13960, partial [Saprospiraceae bacterium]|nr:hypothetical protein [Saprospiraceae bacterium]